MQTIQLLSAGDLEEEFGISPNALQHRRETGAFPPPWLKLNNRNLWLREVIESYETDRTRKEVEASAAALSSALARLDPAPTAEAFSEALDRLAPAQREAVLEKVRQQSG